MTENDPRPQKPDIDDLVEAGEDRKRLNEYDDPSYNQRQGPTPMNQSNWNYAKRTGNPMLWNGPVRNRSRGPDSR